jgi:ubiquinone/menaquinone biosynthesis C-methylase UbiE
MSTSGWQLAGEAPTAYTRFGHKIMEPWTDDLIRSARCRDGDRVLDIACGTGIVANRINAVTGKWCAITGIDLNEGMLNVARRNPQIDWHKGSATSLPLSRVALKWFFASKASNIFPTDPRQ